MVELCQDSANEARDRFIDLMLAVSIIMALRRRIRIILVIDMVRLPTL